jgi:hypothetical protein
MTCVDDLHLQVDGELAVREEEAAFLVVRAEDPDDWLVCFEKSPDFLAREWAENMVRVYNRRLSCRSAGPPRSPAHDRPAITRTWMKHRTGGRRGASTFGILV